MKNLDKITNLSDFSPKGRLGEMFTKARAYNQINDQLRALLPKPLDTIMLSSITRSSATFIANNQSIAYRAQKQHSMLLSVLQKIDGLSYIQTIIIKTRQSSHELG